MSGPNLTDAVLAVDALLDDFGTELFAKGISEGEADQRRRDEEAQQYDERRAEHILRVAKSRRLRKGYSEKGRLLPHPREGWVLDVALIDVDDDVVSDVDGKPKAESKVERLKRAERSVKRKAKELSGHLSEELEKRLPRGLGKQLAKDLATSIGERWIHCWSPAELLYDKRPAGPGLVPIPGKVTHGERCLLLAAVHRKFAVGASSTLDPEKASFLCANGQGRGYGHYAILIETVDGLTDADTPILMRMVEKVRKAFGERSGDQQADAVAGPDSGDDSRAPVAQSGRIKLYGSDEEPEIDGVRVPQLTVPQYDVVLALVEADAGLVVDQLIKKSGRGGAVDILKRLAKRRSSRWESVVVLPGRNGRGGYRIL